jgi:hypothetical protein
VTLQVSTKFKELILGPTSFADIFAYGKIRVYSGVQPASADLAPTGTLLAEVTEDGAGGGLIFTQFGPYVVKSLSQDWRMLVSVSGLAGWFRLVGAAADTGEPTYFLPRIDGSIGESGADFTVAESTLTAGQSIAVQQFSYTIPPIT